MAKRTRISKPKKIRRPKQPQLQGDALVAEATDVILALLAKGGAADVQARAEVGGWLRKVRDQIAYGSWERWVEEHLPFRKRTADRAIALHAYSVKDPALFAKLAPFGIARAQLLLGLHKSVVLSMLGNKHTIPSTGVRKSIAQMTFSELLEVVRGGGDDDPDPAEALVGSYRRQARQLMRTLHALVELRDQVDEDDIDELAADLLSATQSFVHAFGVEP